MTGQVSRTTPSVIIGMGGSGDWVLRQVKGALQRSHGGRVPPAIQLIGIDTAAALPATERASGQPQFVAPELSPGERVRLNGNIQEITTLIARYRRAAGASRARSGGAASVPDPDNVANLASWFVAELYEQSLPQSVYDLSMGAAQLRQFGRMAVALDVRNPGSHLMASIRQAIQEAVRSTTRHDRSLEIILVASIAGGTGAGMFIDIAHLVRREAQNALLYADVRAFLFTPRVFRSIPGGDSPAMRARAFAAMREANRFYQRYGYPMASSATDAQAGRLVYEAIFDHLYYIDGNSPANSLDGQSPDQAHFPMVADAILSIVDDARAGETFGQHSANVRGALASIPNVPVCSAVSAYTYILPVELWRRQFGLQLLTDALDQLFPIRQGPGGGAEPLLPEATIDGQLNETGDAGAYRFMMQATFGEEDAQVAASGFTSQMFTMLEGYVPGNPLSVRQIGQQGIDRFRTAFTPVKASDTAQQLRDMGEFLDLKLSDHLETGRDHAIPRRLTDNLQDEVTKLIQRHVGSGDQGHRLGGEFQDVIELFRTHHRNTFRETLTMHVDALLNPPAGRDYEVAVRRGRLGYLQDFCASMTRQFDQYDNLMEVLLPHKANAERDADQRQRVARQVMVDSAEYVRRIPAGWLVTISIVLADFLSGVLYLWWQAPALWSAGVGRAFGIAIGVALSFIKGAQYSSRQLFIDASQEYVDAVQENLLLQAMRTTARSMRDDVVALKESVDKWAEVLRTGHTPSSVYRELDGSLQAVKADRINLEKSSVRTYVRDQTYEEEVYNRATEYHSQTRRRGAVTDLATSFRWPKLVWDTGTLPLRTLQLVTPASADGVGGPASFDLPQDREFDRALLSGALRDRADAYFRSLGENTSIISFLGTCQDPFSFAETLWDQMGQGVKLTLNGAQQLPQRNDTLLLRSASGATEHERDWLRKVADHLSDCADFIQHATVWSSDRHSLTLVYTSDFLNLEGGEVLEYDLCRQSYYDLYNDSANIVHVLPAELHANQLERLLPSTLAQAHRYFDIRVVALLEHVDRVELFLRARALGVVTATALLDNEWGRRLELQRSSANSTLEPIQLTQAMDPYPSVYAALRQFVLAGQDRRSNPTEDYTGQRTILIINFDEVVVAIEEAKVRAMAGSQTDGQGFTYAGIMHEVHQLDDYESQHLERDMASINETSNNEALCADLNAVFRILLQSMRVNLLKKSSNWQQD